MLELEVPRPSSVATSCDRATFSAAFEAQNPLGGLGHAELERMGALERGQLEDRARRSEPLEEGLDPLVVGIVDLAAEALPSISIRVLRARAGDALRDHLAIGRPL